MYILFQDGDSSSTTSSVEVMPEQEEEPGSNPVTGSPTGPKFVLRLASREHLGKRLKFISSNYLEYLNVFW